MKQIKIFWTLIALAFTVFSFSIKAQISITDRLATPDSGSNAKAVIRQDSRIDRLLVPTRTLTGNLLQSTANGYRVQVFSSNTQRTAKTEAFQIEKRIKETFLDYSVYVTYSSPFWKVRVGDFKTTADAHEFLLKVRDALPDLKGSAYVVKDQINVYEKRDLFGLTGDE